MEMKTNKNMSMNIYMNMGIDMESIETWIYIDMHSQHGHELEH
jgi:hypothetical protein